MTPSTPSSFRVPAWLAPLLPRPWFHVLVGAFILALDLFTGPYLLFPIFFIIPVSLAAWHCASRPGLAQALAVVLPLGRFVIAEFVDHPAPLPYIIANTLIRIGVLSFLAFLVSRTARQTRELEARVSGLVTICAWSKTVEYEGEWLSFEAYLKRRFDLETSHTISPAEIEKHFPKYAEEIRDQPKP